MNEKLKIIYNQLTLNDLNNILDDVIKSLKNKTIQFIYGNKQARNEFKKVCNEHNINYIEYNNYIIFADSKEEAIQILKENDLC